MFHVLYIKNFQGVFLQFYVNLMINDRDKLLFFKFESRLIVCNLFSFVN